MNFIFLNTSQEVDNISSDFLIDQIKEKCNSKILLNTSKEMKNIFINIVNKEKNYANLDFSKTIVVNIGEYLWINKTDKLSLFKSTNDLFFSKLNFHYDNIKTPDFKLKDEKEILDNFQQKLDNLSPFDFCILNIDSKGRINSNSSLVDLDQKTNIVRLSEKAVTRRAKKLNINPIEHPTSIISVGISDILKSKNIILIAKGSSKKKAIQELYKSYHSNEVNLQFPLTLLINSPNVTVITDFNINE